MPTRIYPPGPKQRLPGSSLLAFRRDPIGFLMQVAREYGDVAHFKLALQDVFLLNHPDNIRDVLVTHNRSFAKSRALERAKYLLGEGLLTSEGEFHRRQRKFVQPAFHRERIAEYGSVMTEYAQRMQEGWQDGETLDIRQEMMRLTLSIAGKTLFGTEVESEADEVGEALTATLGLFNMVWVPFADQLLKLPLPSSRRFHAARERLDAVVYSMIDECRAGGEDRGDLLSMLLLVENDGGDGATMTDEQLRDEVLTLLLAGHETTANALTWTWYLLSEHPDVQSRLEAEIDKVLGGRAPTVEDLRELQYVRMVLAEAMRLYPPAWVLGRRALDDYEVGGYILPAGSIVLMSQYIMHRDPRYFPDPSRFDPGRWAAEAQAGRPRFAYFPFGGGSRQCIGEAFAWMEGVLLLATLAQHWHIPLAPDHKAELQPQITLRPKYGMRTTLHRR